MSLFSRKKRSAATIRSEIESLQKELDLLEGREEGTGPAKQSPAKMAPPPEADNKTNRDLNTSSANPLFATLSHELRTPLNGVLGMTQLLKETIEDEKLDTLEGCAQHMQSVLHTLVNLSKIQEQWGKLPEHREWINLHDLLEQIKKNIAHRAISRRLKINIVHSNDSVRLRGDYDHLIHIIETALLGSLECTDLNVKSETQVLQLSWKVEDSHVELIVENPLEIMPSNRGLRILEVAELTSGDTPARIRMEYLYWAVSVSLLEHYEGAMIASKIGDDIGVKTVMAFNMESMVASPSDQKPIGGLSLETSGTSKRGLLALPFSMNILIVEDDPVSRDLMALLLDRIGQKTEVAPDGQAAMDLLDGGAVFDLILMDIDMPVMDGVTTTRSIRMSEVGGTTKTPIVAVTAFNTLSDQSKFKKAGMDYFLTKPVSVKDLRSILIDVERASS